MVPNKLIRVYETKIICIIKHDCQTQLQSVVQTPCKVHCKSAIVPYNSDLLDLLTQ